MPPGVLPPLIMQMDAGSVPVGYLVLQSKTHSLGEMGDLAQMRIRALVQSNVPGTVATSPFGTNVRAIVISVDPDRLRAYNLTPDDVVGALNQGNFISPSGNVYIQDEMPLVPNNAMIKNPQDFGNIPTQDWPQRLRPRCRHRIRRHRFELRLRTGERPQIGVFADCEEKHRFHIASGSRYSRVDADFQKRAAR